MTKPKQKISTAQPDALFGRVVSILEQAQSNVVRAVNSNMVLAYWLIGREIVQELQGGEERAAYGKGIVADSPPAGWRIETKHQERPDQWQPYSSSHEAGCPPFCPYVKKYIFVYKMQHGSSRNS